MVEDYMKKRNDSPIYFPREDEDHRTWTRVV